MKLPLTLRHPSSQRGWRRRNRPGPPAPPLGPSPARAELQRAHRASLYRAV